MTALYRATHRRSLGRVLAFAGLGRGACHRRQRGRGASLERQPLARRLLDARRRVQQDHPGLPGDPRRQRRHVQAVLRRLGHAGGRRPQRPSGRRREPLARARRLGALAGGPGRHELEQGQVRRHGHRLDRRVRRAQGQPQEHQDLERPDQAGHPGHQREPVHLGRRALERHGRLGAQIKQHKTPAQANSYLKALYKNIAVQDSSARASMEHVRSGKGDVLLAYENEAIQARRPARTSSSCGPRRRS